MCWNCNAAEVVEESNDCCSGCGVPQNVSAALARNRGTTCTIIGTGNKRFTFNLPPKPLHINSESIARVADAVCV